jgi:hypothetical protein
MRAHRTGESLVIVAVAVNEAHAQGPVDDASFDHTLFKPIAFETIARMVEGLE